MHHQLKASVLASSSEKDGGDVINDFDIEEEEILIENRLETGPGILLRHWSVTIETFLYSVQMSS